MSEAVLSPTSYARRLGRLAGLGLVAAVASALATTLVAVVLEALGADYEVDEGTIPVAGFGSITFFFCLVGLVVAAVLLRWSPNPVRHFVQVAAVLTALSLVPPVLWGHGPGTVLGLVVLHLVAAAVMVTATTRILRRVA